MRLTSWSGKVDRRAQRNWRKPYVAPLYAVAALAAAVFAAFTERRVVPLTLAAVWAVLALVALSARRGADNS